jgi:dienelactone hydrolase
VQPYGLVVPASYRPGEARQHRLDCWFHGRGETLSELAFILGRQSSPGEFTPPHAFVVHPYGRYCNANKFAGEIDLFEALDHIKKHYPIDEDRIAVRGFSMGGAACWQFAVHYPGLWAAAAPGAGFSETADFLKVFQKESLQPTAYEQKLWHWYDCTDYAINLANCPTVAYSGEKDSQKQAADMMAKALEKEGIELVHLIGPGMGHAYHPNSKLEINRRIDAIVAKGRQSLSVETHFTTWTLRYNSLRWLRIEGLEEHWKRARVDTTLSSNRVYATTENVSALTFDMGPGTCDLDSTARSPIYGVDVQLAPVNVQKKAERKKNIFIQIDEQEVLGPPVRSDQSWKVHLRKEDGKWSVVPSLEDGKLRKRPGLQGPIDDAFLSRFLFVKPTGTPLNEKVGAWAKSELEHGREQWKLQFRGEAPIKDDTAVTDADIADSNLVLWGDPSSNKLMARVLEKLPVRWTSESVQLGDKTHASASHVPLLIYPNPLNPKRYVVLNSGFTYREYDYLNNARQVPKLPDFAVVDVNTPPTSRFPGKIVDAGFFDEEWKVKK